MFDSNRRQYPRANYPCHLTIWLVNGTNETILANTSNVGIGGICVLLNEAIALKTKLDVQLNFTNPAKPFRTHGVVVRSVKQKDNFYNVGIQFESLSDPNKTFLEGKISELIALEQKAKQ